MPKPQLSDIIRSLSHIEDDLDGVRYQVRELTEHEVIEQKLDTAIDLIADAQDQIFKRRKHEGI